MLSIGKLGQGQADYYLQAVGQGIEDYYTGAGEAPGRWLGSASDEVGVSGEVEGDALRAALNGNHPVSGGQLARPARGGIRVPGFDLTFSAPKSVSVLFGLADPAISREVREAHEAAVDAALDYMERHAAVGRRGRAGIESVLGNGFLAAAFRHRTSRAGDPQLHTHVLVANMTRGPDGRWTALDARRLYAHAKTGGYLYQAHLRAELTRRLGVEWNAIHRGVADVAGVPVPLLRSFSRRRAEIQEQMTARGDRSSRAAQVAALDTRQAKDYAVAPETLAERWRAQARALEFEPDQIAELTGRSQAGDRPARDDHAVHDKLASRDGLTQQRSTFVRRDVIRAWCEQLPDGAPVPEVERLADEFIESDRAVPLAADVRGLTITDVIRRADGRVVPATAEERPHSTPELLELERSIIDTAIARGGEASGKVGPEPVEAALAARPTLSDEQKSMVRRLTTDGAGVAIVVGKAGTGKTFALDAAREAWERAGFRVSGAALARRAARELQDGSGIESTSVAALLQDLREGGARGLLGGGRMVLVVDEAGMVGTRQLAELLDHAGAARAKVVLVGDDHQLPEIDAGGAFRGLTHRLEPIRLTENRRQEQAWEREALDLLRHGRATEAITRYDEHGRVVVAGTAGEAHSRLVSDWWASCGAGEESVMVAARRDDVVELNAQARVLMASSGRLGATELEFSGRQFAVGDHVVTLSNARRLGVLNGTRAVVVGLDEQARELELATNDGRRVRLPAYYLDGRTARGGPMIDHGYAITGHKSQGMTTGRAFVLGTEELYREWGYVALSRGRIENRLYVVAPEPHERDEYAPHEPRREPLEAITSALARSRAQHMALDVDEQLRLAALPSNELRGRLDELESALRPTRSDAAAERALDQVKQQRAAAAHAADEAALARANIESQLSQRKRRAGTPELARAEAVERQAAERASHLAAREEQLMAQRPQQPSPDRPADVVDSRAAPVRLELERRIDLAVRAAIAQPPAYLVSELGPIPDRPSYRSEWHRAARAIETYRQRYGVRERESALGQQPRQDLRRRAAWREAQHEIERTQQQLAQDVDRAHETGRPLP